MKELLIKAIIFWSCIGITYLVGYALLYFRIMKPFLTKVVIFLISLGVAYFFEYLFLYISALVAFYIGSWWGSRDTTNENKKRADLNDSYQRGRDSGFFDGQEEVKESIKDKLFKKHMEGEK